MARPVGAAADPEMLPLASATRDTAGIVVAWKLEVGTYTTLTVSPTWKPPPVMVTVVPFEVAVSVVLGMVKVAVSVGPLCPRTGATVTVTESPCTSPQGFEPGVESAGTVNGPLATPARFTRTSVSTIAVLQVPPVMDTFTSCGEVAVLAVKPVPVKATVWPSAALVVDRVSAPLVVVVPMSRLAAAAAFSR